MPPLFSFFGRIGRLEFLVGSVVVTAGAVAGGFLFTMFAVALCATRAGFGLAILLLVGFGGAVLWTTLALYTRRARDIGWDPFVAVGGWFALEAIDVIVARLVPSLALGKGFTTGLGPLANLAMLAAFLLWPGREGADPAPSRLFPPDLPRSRVESLRMAAATAAAPGREPILARPAPALRAGFGRRGLAG